jgi:hypothetical protein
MNAVPHASRKPSSPLTVDMVRRKFWVVLAKGDGPGTAYHHALYHVLAHFLGEAWLRTHVLYGCPRQGYLSMNPTMADNEFGFDKAHTQRVLQLAETLFNLQGVPGIDERLDLLFRGQIESTMAELDFGMFLRMQGADFRYVPTSGVKGRDYDVELIYPDGLIACADSKCKLDGSAFSRDGLLSTLKKTRKQLPVERPGIAFVKVPREWVDRETGNLGLGNDVADLLDEFFRATGRVVLVALYSRMTTELSEGTAINHVCLQLENRRPRFERAGPWGLFDRETHRPVWISLNACLRPMVASASRRVRTVGSPVIA